MSQQISKSTMLRLLERLSALYQMNIISAEQRNRLVKLTKAGLKDNFNSLYTYISDIQGTHPLIEEIKDIIIFS